MEFELTKGDVLVSLFKYTFQNYSIIMVKNTLKYQDICTCKKILKFVKSWL